ncbi:MAG: FlgO family outer membrane protein [Desulfurivibrio sp.]|nr:FlgO family outer membrane protein [Desulfurivibrio sp.]
MNKGWLNRLGYGLGLVILMAMVPACSGLQRGQDRELNREASQEQNQEQSQVAGEEQTRESQPELAPNAGERLVIFSPAATLEARPTGSPTAHGSGGDGPKGFRYRPEDDQYQGADKLLEQLAREVAGQVYYGLRERQSRERPRVAVTAAVPLADFKMESEFGRVLAEYLLTDLAARGLAVTELRLGRDIHIIPQTGEFILSRNIGELASDHQELDYVVVSTYSNTRRTLMLHGRLVELESGLVQNSWRHSLPLNRELIGLFNDPSQSPMVTVRGVM